MRGLIRLALIGGAGFAAWKGWQSGRDGVRDRALDPIGATGMEKVRDAGPAEQPIDAGEWDLVDQQLDESFPASDPPSNYRGVV